MSKAMAKMKGMHKWCKVLVDEVHIKQAIRYRGYHLIGSSIDNPSKAARTALTIMVCPLMGGPSFVARILLIYSTNHNLLHDTVK